jgi:hypothetical protein
MLNCVGQDMPFPGLSPLPRPTMRLGINQTWFSGWATSPLRNLRLTPQGRWQSTSDANGNPIAGNTPWLVLTGVGNSADLANTRGIPWPQGAYRVYWDDENQVPLTSWISDASPPTTLVTASAVNRPNPWNGSVWKDCYQDFTLIPRPGTSDNMATHLNIGNVNIKNVRVYGPGENLDPNDPAMVNWYFKEACAGAYCVRLLELSEGVASACPDYDLLRSPLDNNLLVQRSYTAQVSAVGPIGGGSLAWNGQSLPITDKLTFCRFEGPNALCIRMTLVTPDGKPHQFRTGQYVKFTPAVNKTYSSAGSTNGIMAAGNIWFGWPTQAAYIQATGDFTVDLALYSPNNTGLIDPLPQSFDTSSTTGGSPTQPLTPGR